MVIGQFPSYTNQQDTRVANTEINKNNISPKMFGTNVEVEYICLIQQLVSFIRFQYISNVINHKFSTCNWTGGKHTKTFTHTK